MQLFNKKVIASRFAYTWYLYPVIVAISFICWFWSFGLFHQPNAHEKIVLFFGADVNDVSFTDSLQTKINDDKLQLIEVNDCAPDKSIYGQKLKIYLSNADIIVLPEDEVDNFAKENEDPKTVMDNFFCAIDEETKNTYLTSTATYYDYVDATTSETISYGVLVKDKDSESWLSSYVRFENGKNYYALLTACSTNTGKLFSEENARYDNAIKALSYLVGGIE